MRSCTWKVRRRARFSRNWNRVRTLGVALRGRRENSIAGRKREGAAARTQYAGER